MKSAPAAVPPPAAAPARLAAPDAAQLRGLFSQAVARGLPEEALLVVVDVPSQSASLVSAAGPLVAWPVSTALAGTGNASGSNKTPLGWHRVESRFGAGAAPGTMFVSRRANGRRIPPEGWRAPSPAEDAVLTRVMWLEGLEPGVNKGPGIDSHERCIYMHGTNQEQLLGTPASHGCIRFSNAAIKTLFGLSAGVETWVFVKGDAGAAG
ncbi:MAG: L,D-transpeptidase [Kiritimatiellae bacterium]|nr:L,D-transpeptidase [Kiritimatiellia bacterium]